MRKIICSLLCASSVLFNSAVGLAYENKTSDMPRFSYKISMESDSDFKSLYGYSGGSLSMKKAYVPGKYGNALQITYPGQFISDAAKRYNGYVLEFKPDEINVGSETLTMLDVMRTTGNISLWVKTPVVTDHGNGTDKKRIVEFIFDYNTTEGSKKYSKKFEIPNRGDWEYITLPASYFTSGQVPMNEGIQDSSYTSLARLTITFPYKDYFGANPDESTLETPWEEPFAIDEILFDRSTEEEKAVIPPSTGEEEYHENANIKSVSVNGVEAEGFDPQKSENTVYVPSYYTAEQIQQNVTVEVEAPDIEKTNTNQGVSGATYYIEAPDSVPGKGKIHVTSASGKIKKVYDIDFRARSGLQVDVSGITASGGELTVPVINESSSGDAIGASVIAVVKNADGVSLNADISEPHEIGAGETVNYSLDIDTQSGDHTEIYVINNETEYKLMCAPVRTDGKALEYSEGSSDISECNMKLENGKLNISAGANGTGTVLTVLKKDSGYIGAYLSKPYDGKADFDINLGENARGSFTVYIAGNNVVTKNLYYATDTEITQCISDFNSLDNSADKCADYFEKYKNILNLSDMLGDKLTEDETGSAISTVEKKADTIDEIRKKIGTAIASYAVTEKNSYDVMFELYHNYNDIVGFDDGSDCFIKYITDSSSIDEVLKISGESNYGSMDSARDGFSEAVILVSIRKASGYGQIGEIIEGNEDILGKYIDYSKLRALDSSQRSGYYKSVAEKQNISSLDELGSMLNNYRETSSSQNTGGGSGGGAVSGVGVWAPPSISGQSDQEVQTPSPEKQETVFSDVPQTHWAYSSIRGLKNIGIIDGRDDGTFGTDDFVTREEFVKMLLGTFGIEPDTLSGSFKDVDNSAWYAPYVNTAAQMGIVSGIEDGIFGTGMNISRQDMMVLIARALESKGYELNTEGSAFSDDSDIAYYAHDSVYGLKNIGLIDGMDDNMFKPLDEATRAQTAKILYSLYNYISEGSTGDVDISGDDKFSVTARKMIAFGIIDTPMNEDDTVTKGQFAGYIAGFMNASPNYTDSKTVFDDVPTDNPHYGDIRYLSELGVISDEGSYYPDNAITYGEAVTMLCRVAGYDSYAVRKGAKAEDYLSVALDKDIIDPINKALTDSINFGEVLELLNTASECEMLTGSIVGQNMSYDENKTTPLYYYHKISYCEGELTVSGSRSLHGNASQSGSGVMIDSMPFVSDLSDSYRYLGYKVKGYYTEDQLKFVEPDDRNEITVIESDQIYDFDGNTLSYYKDAESSSVKKENLPKSINLMYNYNYVSEYDNNEVINAEQIILIDNNSDGKFDTINVINEISYCVSQISSYDGTIYGYLEQSGIKTEDADSVVVYDCATGKKCGISDIKTNDVLSVISDKQNRNYIIYISRDTFDGVVESVYDNEDEFYAVIDGTKLVATDEVMASGTVKGYFAPGNGVKVYLDRHSRIAYAEMNNELSDSSYAYLVKAVSSAPGEKAHLKLYSDKGEFLELEFADNAIINSEKVTEETDISKIFEESNIELGSVNQLIRYKLNDEGRIKQVRTAKYIKGEELYTTSEVFTRADNMQDIYYNATYNNFPGYVRINSNTLILSVPESSSLMSDPAYYGIKDFKDFKSNTFDSVEVYNMSKDMTAGIIVLRSDSGGGSALTYSSTVAAIKEIRETSLDGNESYTLTLLYNGAEEEYTLADGVGIERQYTGTDGSPVTSVLEEGDLIRIATNSADQITDYHKVFDFDNEDDPDIVRRGNEYSDKKSYIGSEKTMIAFNGMAANPSEDVITGRIWQGKNPYWFTGVQYSTEFGIVKSIHGTTMIVETYAGTQGNNSLNCERYFNLKNDRVYILEDGRDGVRLGSCDDIIPADLAGEANASRVIIARNNDVPSMAAVVNR